MGFCNWREQAAVPVACLARLRLVEALECDHCVVALHDVAGERITAIIQSEWSGHAGQQLRKPIVLLGKQSNHFKSNLARRGNCTISFGPLLLLAVEVIATRVLVDLWQRPGMERSAEREGLGKE